MLTSHTYSLDDHTDFIHNYYERLVVQEAYDQSTRIQEGDRDFLADVACVALNRLPPRYIRHDVDMTFFMSPQDLLEIENKVAAAVQDAIGYVEARERGEELRLPPVEARLFSSRADMPPRRADEKSAVAAHEKPAPAKSTKTDKKKK